MVILDLWEIQQPEEKPEQGFYSWWSTEIVCASRALQSTFWQEVSSCHLVSNCITLAERICCNTRVLLRDSSLETFRSTNPFWFWTIITDSHILAHINMVCPDDRSAKLGTYISELILGRYQYIIIINIKDWTLWSVLSPELQLLAPTLLRSSNCSPSLWSVVVWFQSDSLLWHIRVI